MGIAIEGFHHFNVVKWVGLPTSFPDPGDPIGVTSNRVIRRDQPIVKKMYYFKMEPKIASQKEIPHHDVMRVWSYRAELRMCRPSNQRHSFHKKLFLTEMKTCQFVTFTRIEPNYLRHWLESRLCL
jgi:hypothetical protein